LNNKGQFSIIAALLVAVILITTVVITYSTIRNSPIQDQPQVLSAIDETNLALKQILGFTVGYYGSVLQVTGNSTYAKMLATNYLHSGLKNIANMHPDWGASFTVNTLDLRAYWFTNASYSMGNLAVNYSLAGLGMYGITYETSCKLNAQIGSTTNNQTQIIVTKDDDEPLINLGKHNFKFYSYVQENSTWVRKNPDSEPIAFANGTYFMDTPYGVDPYSYVVQIEDPRGIIVVASSFSNYILEIAWGQKSLARYAVVGSTPEILGAPDGIYKNLRKGQTCEVTGYENGVGVIKQVYFNITYYGSESGTIEWYCRLDSGAWVKIEDLPQGGTATSPLTRTYNATSLRATWTLENLQNTHIQFKNNFNNDNNDGAFVDAMYVTVIFDVGGNYSAIPNETFVIELLQNGTIRWLGQNLQMTTQAKPVPPIPVKAFHVNQTINNVNQEVLFQIEEWASDYKVPLSLANNASVFSNRNMLVFLINPNVSKVTIWWNGRDTATQTPNAYTNKYFTVNTDPSQRTLNNTKLWMQISFSTGTFVITSKVGASTATAELMRINNKVARWGNSEPMWAIANGTVRAVLQHEVEWGPSSGDQIPNCPNVYAHIVLTLPANATYYTYQLRLVFVNSSQSRTITDLCPIRLSVSSGQPRTENGTSGGYPIVSTETGLFYNFSTSYWQHHWSQLNSSSTKGAGIMFTDSANQMLYRFDTIVGNTTGALNVTSGTIELCPVTNRASVSFTYPLDVIWYGAVVTFDGTTPIYKNDGSGLWITAEYPPIITVTTQS